MGQSKINRFNQNVLTKYEIYNSLFMTLPYQGIYNTGILLPLFSILCEKGYNNNETPTDIVEKFFNQYFEKINEKDQQDLLFRFIQYIERQVVLFDAVEDASFTSVNNVNGIGTLRHLKDESESKNRIDELRDLLQRCGIQTVLTAHPTQFYPDSVLGIIIDLTKAIKKGEAGNIKQLLSQLGQTPFFNKSKPTPYDEAVSLIWYLDNIFYPAASKIFSYIQNTIFSGKSFSNQVIKLGFWPGGDRDGNPFVTPEITKKVGDKLRSTIIRCYYRDMRHLRRRITFREVENIIIDLEEKLYENIFLTPEKSTISLTEIKDKLSHARELIIKKHGSLFLDRIDEMIGKVNLFGFHFASLDIRQDSRIHHSAMIAIVQDIQKEGLDIFPSDYLEYSPAKQIEYLGEVQGSISPDIIENNIARETIASIYIMKDIQRYNGEQGSNRYIISNNQTALNVMETFAMIKLCDWREPTVDIVPLFETVDDLEQAHKVMEVLYTNTQYKQHLSRRRDEQTIMLGFSDGTKDGGYLMANWAIYTAKERLTEISRRYDIKVTFFDGRGGPPARGGGKTHQFYASLGKNIESNHVQMTVQGQTISSNFGTKDACQFNLEQLLSSSIVSNLQSNNNQINETDRQVMQSLANLSYQAYKDFKDHPCFVPYLEKMSVLKYYSKTNIGSRPSKRSNSNEFVFSDLRAIPFVASWSQLKQNVPGFFGLGTSISILEQKGDFDKVQILYNNSLFFRTLVENAMMSLTKSFFKLTAYMEDDQEFGAFWKIIYDEYELTKAMLLKLTGFNTLMENMPSGKASIDIRERIVLPLLTIQQYALRELQQMNKKANQDSNRVAIYEKIVTRSLFGNTNASRNSA